MKTSLNKPPLPTRYFGLTAALRDLAAPVVVDGELEHDSVFISPMSRERVSGIYEAAGRIGIKVRIAKTTEDGVPGWRVWHCGAIEE